jgi:hypothetical protein
MAVPVAVNHVIGVRIPVLELSPGLRMGAGPLNRLSGFDSCPGCGGYRQGDKPDSNPGVRSNVGVRFVYPPPT